MKRSYIELWSILAIAFVMFLALSRCGDEIKIGSITLRTPDFSAVLPPVYTEVEPVYADTTDIAVANGAEDAKETEVAEQDRRICLTDSAMTILLIGDSMAEGLSPRLAGWCNSTGHTLYTVIWYSSSTYLYGTTKLLADYIRVLKPDYIFLTLGGNELLVNDIVQRREKYVNEIIHEIGDIPYLWIGPPNWKEDTGINQLIIDHVPEGCYFPSKDLTYERKKDGAHPTLRSSAMWMDSIMHWMPDHGLYYMYMQEPEEYNESLRPKRMYIHQPGELTERPR